MPEARFKWVPGDTLPDWLQGIAEVKCENGIQVLFLLGNDEPVYPGEWIILFK